MFPTIHFSKETPDQRYTAPSSHNSRYTGWYHHPAQLSEVASSLHGRQTERHVRSDIPSGSLHDHRDPYTLHQPARPLYETQPRTASVAQDTRSSDTYLRDGSRRPSSLQGAFETPTRTRHNKENTEIRHDPPVRRRTNSVSSTAVKSQTSTAQQTYLHALLALPPTPLIYDLRYPPNFLSFPSSSPYAGRGTEVLRVPLTPAKPKQIRLISPDFPWAFDIGDVRGPGREGVTCLEVLAALYSALQRPLTDTEWGAAGEDKRAGLIRSRNSRMATVGNSTASTRHRVRFADEVQEHEHEPRDSSLLRVDWLGSCVMFGGLVKDEEFARKRLIPGAGERPETWVVKVVS